MDQVLIKGPGVVHVSMMCFIMEFRQVTQFHECSGLLYEGHLHHDIGEHQAGLN